MVKFVMPDNLSDETQKFIKDVVKELNARKAIQNIDLGAIRMLATSYEMYMQATDILLKESGIQHLLKMRVSTSILSFLSAYG